MIDDFLVISSPFSPIDSFSKYFDQKLPVQKVKRGLIFESNKSFFLSLDSFGKWSIGIVPRDRTKTRLEEKRLFRGK